MKKFLALFLVMAMLVASFAMLSSCKDEAVDKADAKDDPYTTLMKASRNTINNFFVVNDDAKEIIKDASKKGSYSIILSDAEDLDMPFEKMSSTVYADIENKSFVYDQSLTMDGDTLTSRFYMNKDTMAVSNSEISRSLKIDFETLIAELKTSALMEMTGLNEEEEAQQYIDILLDAFKEVQKSLKESYADSISSTNEYIAIFMGEISETEITVDDEKISALKVPFTFNAKNIEKFINKAINSVKAVKDIEGFEDSKLELLDEMKEALGDSELTIDAYINQDNTSFSKISIKADVDMGGKEAPVISGDILVGTKTIVFKGSAEMSGQKYALDAEIEKKTEGSLTTFDYSVDATITTNSKDATMKLANGKMEYNSESGKYSITLNIPEEEYSAELKGTFKADGSKVTFAVTSFSHEYEGYDWETLSTKTYNDEYEFKVEIVINSDVTVPEMPKNATDIMDLSEEDWMELEDELENISLFGRSSYEEAEMESLPY